MEEVVLGVTHYKHAVNTLHAWCNVCAHDGESACANDVYVCNAYNLTSKTGPYTPCQVANHTRSLQTIPPTL